MQVLTVPLLFFIFSLHQMVALMTKHALTTGVPFCGITVLDNELQNMLHPSLYDQVTNGFVGYDSSVALSMTDTSDNVSSGVLLVHHMPAGRVMSQKSSKPMFTDCQHQGQRKG